MRRVLVFIVGGLLVLVLGAAGVAAFLLSQIDVKAELEKAVEQATGRDVTIAGNASVAYFPTLSVRARDVRIANIEGGTAPAFLDASELEVGVEVLALLERRLTVSRLVLKTPKVALEVNAAGAPNWVFTPKGGAKSGGGDPMKELADVDLGDVRVENGQVTYVNAKSKASYALDAVNLKAELESLAKPLRVTGDARYNAEPVTLELRLGDPRAALTGGATPLAFTLKSAPVEAELDGRFEVKTGALEGQLSARGPSLRRLSAWVGAPLGEGPGLQVFSLSGRLRQAGNLVAFENASVALDAIDARGDLTLVTKGEKPLISGRLEVAELNLNPYLAPVPQAEAAAKPTVTVAPVDVADAGGWSGAQIDLGGLNAVNADLDLTTGPLTVNKIRLDRAKVGVVLHDGFLAATLSDLRLYGGTGRGRFEADARGPAVKVRNELDVTGLAAQTFLKDAIGFSNLEGAAQLKLSFTGEGGSQAAIMRSLDGAMNFTFSEGALRGVDLAGVAVTIRRAFEGKMVGEDARTPFRTFTASFAIADGVAATRDLRIRAADAEITAMGIIDIGGQRLDLRITPKSESLLSKIKLIPGAALAAPFRVVGPWTKPEYRLDLGGAARMVIENQLKQVEAKARAAAAPASDADPALEAKAALDRDRAAAAATVIPTQVGEAVRATMTRILPGLATPAPAPATP